MEDSVFTKIIKGEIPCHKVHEDELTMVFMDIHPITPGHTLVISKKQVDKIWELPDEDYLAVQKIVKKLATKMAEVFPSKRIGIKVFGLDVPHTHVHVFPFTDANEFNRKVDMSVFADDTELAEIAKKLAF